MTRREHPAKLGPEASSNGTHSSHNNTTKGFVGRGMRGGPLQTWTAKRHVFEDDSPVSPGTVGHTGPNYFSSPPSVPPKDRGMTGTFRDYRRELAGAVDNSTGNIPSISREPPSAPLAQIAPWASESSLMPSTAMLPPARSFFDDGDDDLPSPSFGPDTARTDTSDSIDTLWHGDERRPSVASASTMGSQDSSIRAGGGKASYQKKLAGFFGEDVSGRTSQQGSDSSIPASVHSSRKRNNSFQTNNTERARVASPASSRPLTPLPSSEIVPWMFQDPKDISQYGDAPIRQAPAGPDKQRFDHDTHSPASAGHLHRFHFPAHRHTRSKEEDSKASPREVSNGYLIRQVTSREEGGLDVRQPRDLNFSPMSPMASRTALGIRGTSPTPSGSSTLNRDMQRSPADGSTSAKRSLFDKIRRHKGDRGLDSLKNLPSSTKSLQDPSLVNAKVVKLDPLPPRRNRDGSVATFDSNATVRPVDSIQSDSSSQRKESKVKLLHGHGKFSTPTRRGFGHEPSSAKDGEKTRNGSTGSSPYWNLDLDMSNMEGIVSAPPPLTPPYGGIFTGAALGEELRREPWEINATSGPGAWDAPDSWAVKKVGDENMARLNEIDEAGIAPKAEDHGIPHCVRVFRIDSTFATLSTSVNTTVSEILQILGKKSFLQDELNNYQIIMRKHDLQRQLAPGERPIAVQKRLLEQAGYEESDHIEEIGREDNSYLCRFTFVPTKLSGYHSLDKDTGFAKMSKFSHVDLQGRSLVTIPIVLYKKAVEIVSLNLSRNLSLDVPKDFIQSCVNLREIKFTSNEAWQLPLSISLASRLTVLDISNNRLEQLEHAELHKIQGLVSIKMSNNKLTHLPQSFSQLKALRSLNISSNYLKILPEFIFDLKTLVDLDISFNSIQALPKIGQLTTLERFWATNNELSGEFPDDFRMLQNLKEIDVRFNGLTSIDVMSHLNKLEQLMAGHNDISKFEGAFARLRIFHVDHNPITRFDLKSLMSSLTSLNLASAKIAQLDDSLFERIPGLTKLNLDKNHFVNISAQIGRLKRLEYLSIAKNPLEKLPLTIGCLQELRFLDVRECNLKKLPVEIWCCLHLDTLNVSSNVLESFPKPTPTLQPPSVDVPTNVSVSASSSSSLMPSSPAHEEVGRLEEFGHRRPSQASGGLLSVGSSPVGSTRKGSIVSVYGPGGRKASVISRTPTESTMSSIVRKDSNISSRLAMTFASSLRHVYLADNRLNDDVFDELTLLSELRVLNLSYNYLDDIPQRSLRRWPHLHELYLSGNELNSLPSDDLEEISSLKVLHINGNKFQVLPAELGKVQKLAILDIGSNSLKYNVSNWPYDWNWNWNRNLKYLNFSGNKRLEIKPNSTFPSAGNREGTDLTNFTSLNHLRVLGLMDVTLTIPSVPDQTEDRRVRTSGSVAGSMAYGMADTLGRQEHLSTIDMVIPRFRGHDTETVLGMFDGQALSSGGSKVAKYLHENFSFHFTEELEKLKTPQENPGDALRRTFLALNKDLATAASQSLDEKEHRVPQMAHRGSMTAQTLSADDLNSGGVATVLFLDNMDLYVANVGDAQAMLMQSDGGFKILTRKHHPAEPKERERIREAGGYVSRHGKLNDVLEVSRAFGYIQLMPAVMAAPYVLHTILKEQDEMILVASRELWDYVTPDVVVDVARSERGDLMRAAQKLRDLAMAFGATGKIMVMMIGVSDLKKRERNRYRGQSLSMGPSQTQDDQMFPTKRVKRARDAPDDSTLARLDQEVEAPTGELSLIFTDIKSSTKLWESYPVAMRSAIKIHNDVMRRQLRIIGGYEVKTEGDAFMVAFPTVTSALLWCFSIQSHLLNAPWPREILESFEGQEVFDADQNVIYRGLSVRVGAHWGSPVCETDPVTRRMDYFGPMVNRASRISAIADGGQITVSADFIAEIRRTLETYAESDRSGSVGSEDALGDDALGQSIRRDLRALSMQGFEVKDLGERKLKGLENPEYLYLMYPHSLAGRLVVQQQIADAEAASASNQPGSAARDSQLTIDTQTVWDLWNVSLRLEMLCSALECPGLTNLKPPETALLERMKNRGGEVTDKFLVQFVEHQVSRIETCITTLTIRNMVRPFVASQSLLTQAVPMGDILTELAQQLAQLKAYKESEEPEMGPA
ncbi:cysteinyl-tRNA synthetase [Xylographa parallela]|nr:cysteinyl-tRNA synthetase [Xylographa parallela]